MQERVVCSISAAAKYEIPANLVLAVAEKEAGRPGQWIRNTNGTSDVGTMQFNTAYLATLARYGITPADVAQAGCYPYNLAAWRLRKHLLYDHGDMWTRAANYHSRTPVYNAEYRADLMVKAAQWADWLQARYPTYDMLKPSSGVRSAGVVHATTRTTRAGSTLTQASDAQSKRSKPTHLTQTPSIYVPRAIAVAQSGQQ
jgi:hypothetical protein